FVTLPAASEFTGISIFIDSRIIRVSSAPTCCPSRTTIFQRLPASSALICTRPILSRATRVICRRFAQETELSEETRRSHHAAARHRHARGQGDPCRQRGDDRDGRRGGRTAAERDVQGEATDRPDHPRVYLGQDAQVLHPDLDRRPRPGRALPLRPHPRPDYLPLQVAAPALPSPRGGRE